MTAKDRWSLRNIYLYLVCLITLVMVIVAAVNMVRSVAELLYPDPYGDPAFTRPVGPDVEELSEEEMERQRELSRASQTRSSVLGLVGSLAMLMVAGPIYVYHWRKIELEQEPPGGVSAGKGPELRDRDTTGGTAGAD